MRDRNPSFTFGPRREPGVYLPPKRSPWLRAVALVAVCGALGAALAVYLLKL